MLTVTSYELMKLKQRLDVLEEAVFKKPKRIRATMFQRLLMLNDFGFLDKILELDIYKKDKAALISVILDIDPENIEKGLNEFGKEDSKILTEQNLTEVMEIYEKLGLKSFSKEAEKQLIKLRQTKRK